MIRDPWAEQAAQDTPRALRAIANQLAALVEQQKLHLLITSYVTAAVPLNNEEREAVRAHIRVALGLSGGAS
ncbi:hypothetical protein [Nocardia concava]|uniref:hypothetical protein n=1 Tax=Nocardia concava TaxID=257281 RepID=UPI0002FF54B8|nr:hypothetical protein [Nocardia concava]